MSINIYEVLLTVFLSVLINYSLITFSLKRQNRTIKVISETLKKITLKDIKARKALAEGNEKLKDRIHTKISWLLEEVSDLYSDVFKKSQEEEDKEEN